MKADKKIYLQAGIDIDEAIQAVKYFIENCADESEKKRDELKQRKFEQYKSYYESINEIMSDYTADTAMSLNGPENQQAGVFIKIGLNNYLVYQTDTTYSIKPFTIPNVTEISL